MAASDAGVASALVNTGQQVGGSIGTSLLNTLAASATAAYLAAHLGPHTVLDGHPVPALAGLAGLHGYTIASGGRRPCSRPAPCSPPSCSARAPRWGRASRAELS